MFSTLLYTIEGTRKNTRLPGGFFKIFVYIMRRNDWIICAFRVINRLRLLSLLNMIRKENEESTGGAGIYENTEIRD
ncbi:hypothetical protein K040078D81_07860 [Blautia hominis]|uniref:Uncharacterized protein n=1 Tax=Blautia hominis TaxID=2025493 RepID=A0ABQ0B5E1_9FIRM